MIHALVPVKSLAHAKTRLAPLLLPDERRELVLAMLVDVLAAFHATPSITAITVVTADAQVQQVARKAGAGVRHDQSADLNVELLGAVSTVAHESSRRALVVFADVPLVTPAELTAFVETGDKADVVLAAARDGGTNAVLLPRTQNMPLLFGAGSLARHLQAAAERGLSAEVVHAPGLGFDVDQPQDVLRLAEHGDVTVAGRVARAVAAGVRS